MWKIKILSETAGIVFKIFALENHLYILQRTTGYKLQVAHLQKKIKIAHHRKIMALHQPLGMSKNMSS